jgi:hypothetical protein
MQREISTESVGRSVLSIPVGIRCEIDIRGGGTSLTARDRGGQPCIRDTSKGRIGQSQSGSIFGSSQGTFLVGLSRLLT